MKLTITKEDVGTIEFDIKHLLDELQKINKKNIMIAEPSSIYNNVQIFIYIICGIVAFVFLIKINDNRKLKPL